MDTLEIQRLFTRMQWDRLCPKMMWDGTEPVPNSHRRRYRHPTSGVVIRGGIETTKILVYADGYIAVGYSDMEESCRYTVEEYDKAVKMFTDLLISQDFGE